VAGDTSPSLEELMERYVDGDVRAFDSLYTMMIGAVTATLRRWLHADDKVNDALQVTWLKLHASRTRYHRGAPVLPWVMTIARNVALDQLRGAKSRERQLDDEAAERIADEKAEIDWSKEDELEVIAAVRASIDQLPESTREVIRLHKLEERPMSEVAEILGIKEGAARVRAHRGYKALARLLLGVRPGRSQ
jgi:RNA polymerase sigma-70 factor, ECF subfamily